MEKLSCGRNYVARCARIEISTKRRRKCSEEPEKVKAWEGERWKSSGEEVPEVFTESQWMRFVLRGDERFQTIRSGKAVRRLVVECFGILEFGKFGRLDESRVMKSEVVIQS
jgi:hypothetical protein